MRICNNVRMALFFFVCMLVVSEAVLAISTQTTEDWARKALQINPAETGEAVIAEWQGGSWKDAGLSGYYRFVLTAEATLEREQSANKLYIQWWSDTDENPQLAYSISVREINEFSAYSLSLPECTSPRCEKITFEAINVNEKTKQVFYIALEGVGEYRFSL